MLVKLVNDYSILSLNKFFCGLAAFQMSAGLFKLYTFFQHSAAPSLSDFNIMYKPAMTLSAAFILAAIYHWLSEWAKPLMKKPGIERLKKSLRGLRILKAQNWRHLGGIFSGSTSVGRDGAIASQVSRVSWNIVSILLIRGRAFAPKHTRGRMSDGSRAGSYRRIQYLHTEGRRLRIPNPTREMISLQPSDEYTGLVGFIRIIFDDASAASA